MRWNREARTSTKSCPHAGEMSVVSVGVERRVCEGCGRLRFSYDRDLAGEVERSMFARQADELHVTIALPVTQWAPERRAAVA